MKKLICLAAFGLVTSLSPAASVSDWTPIFKGIDHATGTNYVSDGYRQAAHCVRVDLTDPDVQLFTTPRASNYVADSRETYSLTVSNFLKKYGLKVATDAGFYSASPGGSDPSTEGVQCEVYGLQICTGTVVSVSEPSPPDPRYATLLFTTNNTPIFKFVNRLPGTNSSGVYTNPPGTYTAVAGYYPIVSNGVNIGAAASISYPDSWVHQAQPRTVLGVSQDNRYLYMMTIDGRQSGYSDGALDTETAAFILLFGAWNAINMDGGGSTALYMADLCGNPLPINHSSYVAANGRERNIGSHFGVIAAPLPTFISDVSVTPGSDTSMINWDTLAEATSQVEYGHTTAYGSWSVLDSTPLTNHSVTLSGLAPGTRYYFRIHSSTGAQEYTLDYCNPFFTTNVFAIAGEIFDLTNVWKYSTNNMDSVTNWTSRSYNDANWPTSRGVLWCDTSNPYGNPAIQFLPLAPSPMPVDPSTTYPFFTYYFRTTFAFTNPTAGATLTFSNYLDDGALFYLNGTEITNAFLPAPPTPVYNSTLATNYNCSGGNATCPFVFSLSGNRITNLVTGTNLLAVEVHNYNIHSPDITFGCALFFTVPPPAPPAPPFITNLLVIPDETSATITWQTRSNSTTRVEYGLTSSLGTFTPLDSRAVTNHSVTLTNLQLVTPYFFRAISSVGTNQYTASGSFSTVPFYGTVMVLTNTWAYSTNNYDGVNWQEAAFDDSAWPGGPALLWVELDPNPNPDVQPKFTQMPWNDSAGAPWTTYYFRSAIGLTNRPPPGFSLLFSNFVDDGAVFYLNGTEIQRLRMPPSPESISNSTFATERPPTGDAVYPDIFRLWGDALTNLVAGTNVLAVEVHNVANSSDITFGSSVGLVRALASETLVNIAQSNGVISVSWAGANLTLQQSSDPSTPSSWSDVPGPILTSPFCLTNPPGVNFFRLRD